MDDGVNWLVQQDFYYDTDVDLKWPVPQTPGVEFKGIRYHFDGTSGVRRLTVPTGFITDFASIPRLLWNLLPPTGRYAKATVIHDYLYRTPLMATRKQADAVLFEAMKFPCHVSPLVCWIIYLGVRVGGHWAYKGGL